MKLYTEKKQTIDIESTPFSKGGEGGVYRITNTRYTQKYCAKFYHCNTPQDRAKLVNIERKIRYMLTNQPDEVEGNNWKLSWPVALLFDAQGQFVGFIMPLAYPKSIKLTEIMGSPDAPSPKRKSIWKHWTMHDWDRFSLRQPHGLTSRLKVVVSICFPIYKVHAQGSYVFVDMKPDNILISPKGEITICDIDSIQILDKNTGHLLFPSLVNTPDYSPPDTPRKVVLNSQGLNASAQQTGHQFNETWDRFSLGVIIYQLLFLVHPFACTAKDNSLTATCQKIKHGLYVHGTKRNEIDVYKTWHNNLLNCPKEIQQFFFNTFDPSKGLSNPRLRISAEKWGKTIYQSLMSSKSTASQGYSSTGATRNSNGNSSTTSGARRTNATSGTQRTSATSGTQRTNATQRTTTTRTGPTTQRAQTPQPAPNRQSYVQPQSVQPPPPVQQPQPQQTTYTTYQSAQTSTTTNSMAASPEPELNLLEYFGTCVFDKFFITKGRARRKEIWGFMLFATLIYIVQLFLVAIGIMSEGVSYFNALILFLPQLAVSIRRLHDLGFSGWWLLAGFIPFVGLLGAIPLLFVEGEKRRNKYGPNPKR